MLQGGSLMRHGSFTIMTLLLPVQGLRPLRLALLGTKTVVATMTGLDTASGTKLMTVGEDFQLLLLVSGRGNRL